MKSFRLVAAFSIVMLLVGCGGATEEADATRDAPALPAPHSSRS